MAYRALGMIEVRGMLGSLIAADAALKAANVELVGNRRIKGGLTTLEVMGDVAAVNAAVEAGVEAVKDLNCIISHHVIANLDDQVERMIMDSLNKTKPPATHETKEETVEVKPEIKPETLEKLEPPVKESPADFIALNESDLQKHKVVELRSLAYQHNIKSLTKREIKFANKQTLIQALLEEGVTDE